MFQNLIESSPTQKGKSFSNFVVSVLAHLAVGGILVLSSLIFYQSLPAVDAAGHLQAPIWTTLPPAPPPPAPPAPSAKKLPADRSGVVVAHQFLQPRQIPNSIPEPDENPAPIQHDYGSRSAGPVTGGIPGGDALVGASGGSAAGGYGASAPPPPPPPRPKEPLRVGGSIQSSKLIEKISPVYPPLARQARVEGVVLLQATIDEQGDVTDIRVIRGHPLLVNAALEAVRQWKYSPTLLNGEAVQVITTISVIFNLH